MKKCFVIMPIRQSGTPEYRHYRALYDNVIRTTISNLGYEVKRADDYQKSGSITKEIILHLAQSDLVIADLTSLNANVFYELGVRHALRGTGTIMILDEKETTIPFDITTYRVIKFRSDMEGIGTLSTELHSYVIDFEAGTTDSRDSLVHDHLPSLPKDVLSAADGTQEGELRKQFQVLKKQLQAYIDKYGQHSSEIVKESPLDIVRQALDEAVSGSLPTVLVDSAEKQAKEGNHKAFLESVFRIMELRTTRPSPNGFMRLANAANLLDHKSVAEAILEHANSCFPSNRDLRMRQLQTFAHSEDYSRRQEARLEFLKDFGISYKSGKVNFSRELSSSELGSFSIMLDAYHKDGLNSEALELVAALNTKHPGKSILVRNLGRALERIGDRVQSLKYYTDAALAPDADDTAAVWLGNELHNRERHVDAAEAYTIACLKDPSDPANFAHLADELAWSIREEWKQSANLFRRLPPELLELSVVQEVVLAALSCGSINIATAERLRSLCSRLDLDLEEIAGALGENNYESRLSQKSRVELVRKIRLVLSSDLTSSSPQISEKLPANSTPKNLSKPRKRKPIEE
jgi:hypothetical protein